MTSVSTSIQEQSRLNTPRGILWFIVALIAFTLLGFLGYYFGFLGFIYKVMMPGMLSAFPLFFLSIIFGTAAFFSPCAFSVLPAYVARFIGSEADARDGHALRKGLTFGVQAALGVITVAVLVGLVIAVLGASAPFAKDPRQDIPLILGIRVAAGFLIALMGLLTITGRTLPHAWLQRKIAGGTGKKGAFLYGMLYNGAAIGCTGPILLGLMLYALTQGNFLGALTSFLVFALTMGALMTVLTMIITVSGQTVVKRLAPAAPAIKKIAGWIMLGTGLAIAILTLEGNQIFVKIFFPFLK